MPPSKRGRMRRNCWHHQQHHPLQAVSTAVGVVYELPKEWGCSLSTPRSTHRPLTEEDNSKVMEEIPTSRRHHDKTALV